MPFLRFEAIGLLGGLHLQFDPGFLHSKYFSLVGIARVSPEHIRHSSIICLSFASSFQILGSVETPHVSIRDCLPVLNSSMERRPKGEKDVYSSGEIAGPAISESRKTHGGNWSYLVDLASNFMAPECPDVCENSEFRCEL